MQGENAPASTSTAFRMSGASLSDGVSRPAGRSRRPPSCGRPWDWPSASAARRRPCPSSRRATARRVSGRRPRAACRPPPRRRKTASPVLPRGRPGNRGSTVESRCHGRTRRAGYGAPAIKPVRAHRAVPGHARRARSRRPHAGTVIASTTCPGGSRSAAAVRRLATERPGQAPGSEALSSIRRANSAGASGRGAAPRRTTLRIRVRRMRNSDARGDLDDAAAAHDRNPIRDVVDDREVVRNEQIGEPELRLQVDQQIQDLRLDRQSSADTGSSQITRSGRNAEARAIPMRWRWPPEKLCG